MQLIEGPKKVHILHVFFENSVPVPTALQYYRNTNETLGIYITAKSLICLETT